MHDVDFKERADDGRRNRRPRTATRVGRRQGALEARSYVVPPELDSVAVRLPVRALWLTQIGPGSSIVDAKLAEASDVILLRARVASPSVCVTILDRAYTSFSIVRALDGTFRINGELARPTSIYTSVDSECVYTSGGGREMTTALVRRDSLSELVATLCGSGLEDAQLDNRNLELTKPAADGLRRCLNQFIAEHRVVTDSQATDRVADEVFGWLADACLMTDLRRGRAAELAYFHQRRLTAARFALLRTRPSRGALKRAALEAGLTALGRFSVEYRQLFNESPSVTLAKVS